ncbi:MAG: metallophosphoesterase, partial [Planctomycetota bacterium]
MPNKLRAFLLVALLATPLACSVPPRQPSRPQSQDAPAAIDFTLLYFNDLHGHLEPFQEEDPVTGKVVRYGGVARLAALVRRIERENEERGQPTFLLFAGDVLTGTPLSMVGRGEPDMLCLRLMGVDAFAIGNHEFDFGQENFERLRTLAS